MFKWVPLGRGESCVGIIKERLKLSGIQQPGDETWIHIPYFIVQSTYNSAMESSWLCANTNVVCGTDKKGRGTDYSHLWLGPSIKMVNREGHCPCLSLTNPVVCLSVCPSDSNHSMSVCDHHPIGAIRKAKGGPRAKNSLLMDWEGSHTRAFWTGVAGNGCLVPLVTL